MEHHKNEQNSSISPVSFDLKKLEEEEQMKPKLNRLVEIIKSRKSVKLKTDSQ